MSQAKSVLIILSVLVALARSEEASPQQTQLDGVLTHASGVYEDVVKLLESRFPNTTQISDKFVQHSRQFFKDLKAMVENLKHQVGNNEEQLNAIFSQVSKELSEHIARLKTVIGPDASGKIEQVKEALESSFKSVYESMHKIADALKPTLLEDVRDRAFNVTQELFNKFLDTAKVLRHGLKNTLSSAEKVLL